MTKEFKYEVHHKENMYYVFKIIGAVIGYFTIYKLVDIGWNSQNPTAFLPIGLYTLLIIFYIFFSKGIMIGHLRGNAVKITSKQFPEIHEIVQKQCFLLGIKKIPDVFILQNGGLLNAFATRWMGSDYVVIYSDVMEEAFENNMETVEFIIGHELGHVKRKHLIKRLLLFPAFIIPFLNSAYSRACEYTCDNIGAAMSPAGARQGLILLASGKRLRKRVNIERFAEQENSEESFWFWFAEKVSSHPRLSKRVARFKNPERMVTSVTASKEKPLIKEVVTDHTGYLPK